MGMGHLILPCSTALGITNGSIVSRPLFVECATKPLSEQRKKKTFLPVLCTVYNLPFYVPY
jgi:hypothetical protein